MKANMKVNIAGVEWKNPVTTSSGTFGFGKEYAEYFDISRLGAITVKSVSIEKKLGNASPRVAEVASGMLNSVGLQNPGVDFFMNYELPELRKPDTKIIVNVAGNTIDEYVAVVEKLGDSVDMLELNISCPNVKVGGMAFGVDEKSAFEATIAVKKVAKVPLIVKLSPNVTDVSAIAKAVEDGGAAAISLINTLLGMKIDINKRKPILANNYGGMSGPCVMPVAVRMVHQVAQKVKIPIIGMGGISTGADAIEFMLAGASAVAVGTAGFVDPYAWVRIIAEIEEYLTKNNIDDVNEIIGKLEMN